MSCDNSEGCVPYEEVLSRPFSRPAGCFHRRDRFLLRRCMRTIRLPVYVAAVVTPRLPLSGFRPVLDRFHLGMVARSCRRTRPVGCRGVGPRTSLGGHGLDPVAAFDAVGLCRSDVDHGRAVAVGGRGW